MPKENHPDDSQRMRKSELLEKLYQAQDDRDAALAEVIAVRGKLVSAEAELSTTRRERDACRDKVTRLIAQMRGDGAPAG